jgi:hypothetical protein
MLRLDVIIRGDAHEVRWGANRRGRKAGPLTWRVSGGCNYEGAYRCGAGSSVDLGCPSEGLHKRGYHRWDSRSRCCSPRSLRSDRGLHCRPSQRTQICSSSQTGSNPKTNSSSSSKTGSYSKTDSNRTETSGPRQLLARVTESPNAPTTNPGSNWRGDFIPARWNDRQQRKNSTPPPNTCRAQMLALPQRAWVT